MSSSPPDDAAGDTDPLRQAKRVLVVDDSAVAREIIIETLRGEGYETIGLPSAIGATREAVRNRIDAAIIDINMPALSGCSLVNVFRDNDVLKDVVIIIVSAESAQTLAEVRNNPNVDAVLPKRDVRRALPPLLSRLLGAK